MKNGFQVKKYRFFTGKIKSDKEKFRICMLSDLHGKEFGKDNAILLDAIIRMQPDFVFLAGDMILKYEKESLKHTEEFICRLSQLFPVYYARGNHEKKMCILEEYKEEYEHYERTLKDSGCRILADTCQPVLRNGLSLRIYGLDLNLEYYYNPRYRVLPVEKINEILGEADEKELNILLTHHPGYGDSYFQWGADLIFSGHYHGGIVRFNENCGLISTNLRMFPSYCCGVFQKGDRYMAVSPGMGEHTLPLRIHNPRQVLQIDVEPLYNKNDVR